MATIDAFTPNDTQKLIMLLIKTAPTPKVAYDNVSVGQQNIAARDMLARLGLIVHDNKSAEVTPEGDKLMQDENLIDEMGEPTEEGAALLDQNHEEEETKMESTYPLLNTIVESEIISEMFTPEEMTFIKSVVDGQNDFEDLAKEWKLFDKLVAYAETEMPYGTRKGRDGTPDEWLASHLDQLYDEIVFDEKMRSQRERRSPASAPLQR